MAGGEVCFSVFNIASTKQSLPIKPDVPEFTGKECCFTLPALASTTTDEYTSNDFHTVFGNYDVNYYFNVEIYLQKLEGTWADKSIANGTIGTNYTYGFVTTSTEKYVAFTADWKLILQQFGEGNYRFRFAETSVFLDTTETIYPFEFCLKEYTPRRANNSVRFDYYQRGIMGDWQIDENVIEYNKLSAYFTADGWFNQLRLPSFIGQNKSTYEREYIKYQNGELRYLQDEQVEAYNWVSGYFPAQLHQYIKTEIIQADKIYVTDYNNINPNVINNKQVKPNSSYEPEWQFKKQEAKVNVEFVQAVQNRRKRRC
jgi:hypothetical protein